MHEADVLGMEEKAGGGCAIEVIANDGAMQSIGMGGMYAQLVGAARYRVKGYACGGSGALKHFIACDGGLTMFVIDKLVGAIEQIHAKWQIDSAAIVCYPTIKEGNVSLFNESLGELLL